MKNYKVEIERVETIKNGVKIDDYSHIRVSKKGRITAVASFTIPAEDIGDFLEAFNEYYRMPPNEIFGLSGREKELAEQEAKASLKEDMDVDNARDEDMRNDYEAHRFDYE